MIANAMLGIRRIAVLCAKTMFADTEPVNEERHDVKIQTIAGILWPIKFGSARVF